MKKINSLLITLTLIIGISVALGETSSKIGVVDVDAVVNNSSQVMALKKEQNLKKEELAKWLNVARKDIEKQKTQEGKEKLIKKYEATFAKKQEAIQKDYTNKLQAIDKDITKIIEKTAKDNGYDIVLVKGMVLFGGDDITGVITKLIK